ncbi:MAG: M28 family peptidase [Alphaproteobacteria bacterium]|nr:M28 family peptidase [Alphaproteobacteria bacterium]
MTANKVRRAALALAGGFLALGSLGMEGLAEQEGHEAKLLGNTRQLTFEGRRAGEGYFSADGTKLIFQSEREPDNPFYQIYLMDLETGDIERVSPGTGKTTCAWLHPENRKLLFASTHLDPDAVAKQEEEFAEREKGGRRYSWSFDEHYDIFERTMDGAGGLVNLTDAPGYDAEGSYSPDGLEILFASNRHAYSEPLSPEDQAHLEKDPSFFMDLYVMKADGSDVRRLTDAPGYDGGPFYSADGDKIVWRRFGEDGHSAEIFVANPDGTDERQITELGAMSWAPYFHPSGDYVIFATSVHGFANFELYLVDSAGAKEPVRVTSVESFDSLPVFSPDGRTLAWASSRTADKKPQLFMADWNDKAARELLDLEEKTTVLPGEVPPLPESSADISPDDLRLHVEALASEAMEGRLTGSHGEKLATDYVAKAFERLGLEPAGDDGSYFQPFDFTAGVSLGADNRLRIAGIETSPEVDSDWRPLGMSKEGEIEPGGIVFAGYGVIAPEGDNSQGAYDSYVGLDVEGQWVMVFRHLPEDIGAARRQHLHRYADLGYKAAVARERGAVGLIVVSGPNASVKDELVPLGFDAATAGSALGAISISNDLASAILSGLEKDLAALQSELDEGEQVPGFAIPDLEIRVNVALEQEIKTGRNVLARLAANVGSTGSAVMVGAHVDHLGHGIEGKSLARGDQRGEIHFGADDNASGVAGLLEIAEYFADQKARGKLDLPRDVVFAAWSGEELGLLGSNHFVKRFAGDVRETLQPEIAAYLNLDMIGHYRDSLILQGVGSSSYWPGEIERRNVPVGLAITTNDNAFLPTDAASFYVKGVPVLNAFTGPHDNYSTPADTADTLNYEGAADIAKLMALIARAVAKAENVPDYIKQQPGERSGRRRTSSVYLGTLPDYAANNVEGALINGVTDGGPAAEAGIEGGDLIVEIAGSKIANIYDYSHALDGLKIGQSINLVVLRNGKRKTLRLTPSSRD